MRFDKAGRDGDSHPQGEGSGRTASGRADHQGEERPLDGRRVLLIEDEANIAEAIRFILTRDGWTVSLHGSGTDAVEVIRRVAPDVLVLDVMLPGRSGVEILAEIRADADLKALPVLVLSAAAQGAAREAAGRAGADRFIMKPFSNAEVVASVRALAGG